MTYECNYDLNLGIFHKFTTIFAIFLSDKAYSKFEYALSDKNSNGNCNCKIFKIMVINSLSGKKTITQA
jgi:hypothetical protein